MLVRVLGDPATVGALRLAGLEGRTVGPAEEAGAVFEEMLAEPELGLLVLTEPVAGKMREKVDAAKLERHWPLVLEIPARGVDAEPMDELVARVARLIGIRR